MPRIAPHDRRPCFDEFLMVLRRQKPSRPVLGEMFIDWEVLRQRAGLEPIPGDPSEGLRVTIAGFENLGYDYAVVGLGNFGFPRKERHRADSVSLNEGQTIIDRESFESYPWPNLEKCTWESDELLLELLPEGMKFIVRGPSGVLENVIGLVGFDNLCMMLFDDPQLVKDIFDAVGSRLLRYYEIAAGYDSVGAILSNDDWGYKSQTMLSPEHMRQYLFPWHQRIVAAAHAAGKPAILHSCGNLVEVFDDIIDSMRYDGKHSYEDAIVPVEEAYERWGGRVAVIGGMDVDFLARSTPEKIHARAKAMLERVETRGGYALGSGNSIPKYIPSENYHAMVSAAWD